VSAVFGVGFVRFQLPPQGLHADLKLCCGLGSIAPMALQGRQDGPLFQLPERPRLPRISQAVKDLTDLPPQVQAPDAYLDWGGTEQFRVQAGEGECAS
jgi:hypothetical protein